jgi:hypothetical protein
VMKDESWTVNRIAHVQAQRDPLDQHRLARAELAFERNQVSRLEGAGQPCPKGARLILGVGPNESARNRCP